MNSQTTILGCLIPRFFRLLCRDSALSTMCLSRMFHEISYVEHKHRKIVSNQSAALQLKPPESQSMWLPRHNLLEQACGRYF